MAVTSAKTVAQKLGIKPGFCIFADGAPRAYAKIVGPLPSGTSLQDQPKPPIDLVHLFVTQAGGLAAKLLRYRRCIAPNGMIWVSWPKKSSGVSTDLSDIVVRDTALPLGLVDTKVCAIDDVWSGLKFVIPRDQR